MHERLAQSPGRKHVPGRRIDQARLDPRPNRRNRRVVRRTDCGKRAGECVTRGRQLNRARQIHAVSVVDTSEVQHHAVSRAEPPWAGPGVRKGAVRAGCDDRLECRLRKPRLTQKAVHVSGNLELRPAGGDDLERPRGHLGEETRRLPQSPDLEGILYQAAPLDNSLGRDQLDRLPGGPVAGIEQAAQPLESTEGHRRGFDTDRHGLPFQDGLDQPLFQAPRCQLDLYPL